ncbi:ABEC1 enzyme, partial [Oriolus oriolus]|nr:ABEC1 enzyme [Oriolus oriolus]
VKLLFCCSMYISRWALREHFDPREYPQETYLLCELQWGRNGKGWIHWVRNDHDSRRHAEVCFLDEIFELRSFNVCNITWYLSWSPCEKCCDRIRDFLEMHPNVNIEIYVARIYGARSATARKGLRDLASLQGVNNLASISPDYIYCWDTFLQRDADYDFLFEDFESAIRRNCSMLEDILEVSTL